MAKKGTKFCQKCGKTMSVDQFYSSNDLDKYPDGKLNECKKCITLQIDNWDPETYVWILRECDVPFVKYKWEETMDKWLKKNKATEITGLSVMGRYLSTMKISPWHTKRWKDTDALNEKHDEEQKLSMRAQGYSEDEIKEFFQERENKRTVKPQSVQAAELSGKQDTKYTSMGDEEIEDLVGKSEDILISQLTIDDKMHLRIKWGSGYTVEEQIRLEKLYNDFVASYRNIDTAGHKDTLLMICKASMKAHQLLDAGDELLRLFPLNSFNCGKTYCRDNRQFAA